MDNITIFLVIAVSPSSLVCWPCIAQGAFWRNVTTNHTRLGSDWEDEPLNHGSIAPRGPPPSVSTPVAPSGTARAPPCHREQGACPGKRLAPGRANVLTRANEEPSARWAKWPCRRVKPPAAVGQGARRPARTREGSGAESLVRRPELRRRHHGAAARELAAKWRLGVSGGGRAVRSRDFRGAGHDAP